MQFTEKLNTPGEHFLLLNGGAGEIEAVLTVPDTIKHQHVAFLGHPHSLQGGTMNNKVVTTMARAFKEFGIPSLRFNFRGVGQSSGAYDAGIGESEDMLGLVRAWQKELPELKLICAGFSFGSYVAYRTAAQADASILITIAPPVHHYNYAEFEARPESWLIIQGDADEVVPSDLVYEFARQSMPEIEVVTFADTGHFFHGKLLDLKATLLEHLHGWIKAS
ncbi:alpha/beta hydrolase [uncultured Legionella sp.]|uniref:alpha/beta hydrolase n=1 Tax=uncultured Legionella sp. TaxID=210934 RepID=UPI002608D5AE|nr:alpha/beta family hydrolase [uncultured Legionella sp.]